MNTETIETLAALREASKQFDWAKQTGPAQNELIRAIHLAVVHGQQLERRQDMDNPVRFTVAGKAGRFPFDMLRHDHAWPASSDDAINLAWDGHAKGVNITIELVAQARRAITPARWASFGWTVTHIAGQEVTHG